MIEKIIDYSVRNPFLVIVAALALAGWGVYSLANTPVDAIPDLSENQVIVFADWPGRSPREVEDQVTYPLSVNLQGLSGVKTIRATSEFGFSMINIIFEDGVDFYFARERVLERLSIANTFLPEGVAAYMAPDTTALGQIFWYTVEGDGYDLGRLRAVQDWYVRYQLYSVPGVAEVASVGGYPIEYQVDVDPDRLRAYNVTLGELYSALARSNLSVGGRVIQKGGSEYLVRSAGWIESVGDVEKTVIKTIDGTPLYVGTVASVQLGPQMKRDSLEKNGSEAVGGVVLMRYGENPLEVTRRIKEKIEQLQAGLPEGVRIVPFYERTQLIERSVHTVWGVLREEMIVASLAVLLILWHFRSAVVVCITLPLAVLSAFILMRWFGIASNIMSLSGIAISIGVLVDSSIVMVENATHHLHAQFGKEKVRGDTRPIVLPAMRTVGRPIFFSVVIMLISFAPVFALGGMEGRMFHPLAFTKSFAMIGVAILAITLVPALVPLLIRGRLRGEEESWLVRSVTEIYRPVLRFLLDHPWPITFVTGLIFLVAIPPAENVIIGMVGPELGWLLMRGTVALVVAGTVWAALVETSRGQRLAGLIAAASLVVTGLWADGSLRRIGQEFMPPLHEGTILDMPMSVPRTSITQATDDLKARDRMLRRYPETSLVVGKAGRANTPTDPAPPDMIETVVNLRPREHWPKRELRYADAHAQTEVVYGAVVDRGWLVPPQHEDERITFVNDATMLALKQFDEQMRDVAQAEAVVFERSLGPQLVRGLVERTLEHLGETSKLKQEPTPAQVSQLVDELATRYGAALVEYPDLPTVTAIAQQLVKRLVELDALSDDRSLLVLQPGPVAQAVQSVGQVIGLPRTTLFTELLADVEQQRHERWTRFVRELNWRLFDRAVPLYTRLSLEELRSKAQDDGRWKGPPDDQPLQALVAELAEPFGDGLLLWQRDHKTLLNEMNTQMQMPGWANVWTEPIINRINMLATGVNTTIGVKVYGDDLTQIQLVCDEIADVLRPIAGATDVGADQTRGEGYLEIDIDREKAARYGVNVGDIQDVIEAALGGKTITMTVEGRERFPVRLRYARDFRGDEESVKNLLIAASGAKGPVAGGTSMSPMTGGAESFSAPSKVDGTVRSTMQIPLSQVADVRITEGPSMIKSENGLLRSYVRLNVRDRDVVGFVDEARRVVAEKVKLPPGMYVEWTGQFEHEMRAKRTIRVILPIVVLVIFLLLYVTYHDFADAVLMMLAVPGAMAGGALALYVYGEIFRGAPINFSVAVWVGFIACFGLATETGVVMLVYLREAVAAKGGLEKITLDELKQAVLQGAVHRLRPKLLTEGTTIIGLSPMLFVTGTGAEIMQPMALPVLGGILVADEVIDLLIPVLFYKVRAARWRKLQAARLCEDDSDEQTSPDMDRGHGSP